MHTAFAVELDTVIVNAACEVALVEGDGVASFGVGLGFLIDLTADDVGDEEAGGAVCGQRELDAGGTIVGVGVVLFKYEVGLDDIGSALEVVDNTDDGSLVVGGVGILVRQRDESGADVFASSRLRNLEFLTRGSFLQ